MRGLFWRRIPCSMEPSDGRSCRVLFSHCHDLTFGAPSWKVPLVVMSGFALLCASLCVRPSGDLCIRAEEAPGNTVWVRAGLPFGQTDIDAQTHDPSTSSTVPSGGEKYCTSKCSPADPLPAHRIDWPAVFLYLAAVAPAGCCPPVPAWHEWGCKRPTPAVRSHPQPAHRERSPQFSWMLQQPACFGLETHPLCCPVNGRPLAATDRPAARFRAALVPTLHRPGPMRARTSFFAVQAQGARQRERTPLNRSHTHRSPSKQG